MCLKLKKNSADTHRHAHTYTNQYKEEKNLD